MNTTDITFEEEILEGIPKTLPKNQPYDGTYNHAPKRKAILNKEETKLALINALRYFDKKHHPVLIKNLNRNWTVMGEFTCIGIAQFIK